ncbi:energy transducer TonB [Chryseobacterium pennipullorum]|uniref:TonB C-terminal domain-containing protein n=1 Tax=Chryseobacterium pennipullorum TaxID=2258963 RepID=A0A3D9AQ72_9FLAO|nr:hypothetical protein [Chryseobacterium pennipullorum]REC43478.1 hypothetical protein DRF67_19120 [Chryseobacterium pennipullorum]
MKKIMIMSILLWGTFSLKAQQGSGVPQHTEERPASPVEDKGPEFPGGMIAFRNEFVNQFRSQVLLDAGVKEASAVATFVIEKDGSMSNITMESNDNKAIKDEFIKALKKIKTKWIPGEKNGEIVRVRARQPLVFKTTK